MEEKIDIGTGNKWKYALSAIVADNFRCRYFYYGKSSVIFYGYEKDTEIAAITFKMLFNIGNKESARYYQKKRLECIKCNRRFDGRGIKNAFLNGYLLGIKEALEKQCTALMIVIPKDVEEKYRERTAGFHKISSGFKVRVNSEGEQAKSDGIRTGKNMIMSRGIESVC